MELTKRQNEIIDAALRLTATQGIQGLTVKNLSASIGVTEPALYRHFKNKSEIVHAMVERFDNDVPMVRPNQRGFETIADFVTARFELVNGNPDLAKVMFAEELFMNDPEFTAHMMKMMHRHKTAWELSILQGQEDGEIRRDIAPDILFRLILGPVRLLIKQWGMTNGAFDLRIKGKELLDSLRKIITGKELKP